MLDALRRGSKSWLAKSLLILLVLSFGIWGVADYVVGGGGSTPAIKVGDQEFGQAYVRDQFSRDMSRMRQQGMDLSTEQAISFGVLGQTVQTIVQGAVLDETGASLGLTVTDATLRAAIQSDPLFKNESGVFDRDRLNRLLAANQLNEPTYIALRRRDMIRQGLVNPLSEAAFTAPEYRTSTALVLTREAVAKTLTIEDAAIQEYYDAHQDEFTTGPTRVVTQALFPTEEQAKDALAKVRDESLSLDEAAKAVGTGGAVEMGSIGESDLPAPLPETIFAQTVGAVGEPVKGPFGWHLFLVTEASEGGATPLAEVHDRIRDTLATEQALDRLYTLSAEVDDALAGGATLEETAKQVGVDLLTVTVDAAGKGETGEAVAGLPPAPTFLTSLFEMTEGELGFMTEYESGFFIQRLDGVTASAARPLDTVRDQVIALWQADQRAAGAKALGESLLEKAKGGETLAALAEAEPAATVVTTPPVTRAGDGDGGSALEVPPGVVSAMFANDKGALVLVDLGDAVSILRVTDIQQPPADVAKRERDRLADSLAQSYAQDLSADYLDALGASVGVTVNERVVLGAVSNETQPQ
jgi:peptidyl-prolyl cis-trans isomerase D